MKAEFLIDYCRQAEWLRQEGQRQSPIDIETSQIETDAHLSNIQVNFSTTPATFFNNGQNLQLLGAGEAYLNNRCFQFVQMHFHTDSEHQLDGQTFPLEGHFLFQAPNGQQAVIGVFYQIGAANPDFEQVLKQYEQQGDGVCSLARLLPENKSYYHYIGSLTTPPLTEGVEWYVLQTSLTVSEKQLARFIAIHGRNKRLCQPLNSRKVLSYNE
ncbi:carbonic anhydrase family protein [Enterococcus pseudoavium]|uniref:Carbonic anhydrase n=1 Tax=Enterococcus pseudoavium TaxID=44007 RepID=A0AAE4L1Q7_9ENTE|nr:carbonic anhydrase family protein [Enterococcus pseudoavium]MDT2735858.1 carbonic anhydrase family protein [Enterococcus pseudoavium]MDT2754410.1 carbonic anhydrase family protein [Enterococcus pseudoavium]MDT2769534.1 carbonic anhydrase family protein [Enterococcus pseudoavium]REC30982.1 hypothetical protein CF160_00340 [Enterococcus pseudoavium]